MNESGWRIEWPAARATPQHAADYMTLTMKRRIANINRKEVLEYSAHRSLSSPAQKVGGGVPAFHHRGGPCAFAVLDATGAKIADCRLAATLVLWSAEN